MPDLEIKGFFPRYVRICWLTQGWDKISIKSIPVGQNKFSWLSLLQCMCYKSMILLCGGMFKRDASGLGMEQKASSPKRSQPYSQWWTSMQPSSGLCFQGDIVCPAPCMSIICCACWGLNLISGKLMGHLPLALTELQTDPNLFLFYVFSANSCTVFWVLTTDQKIQECLYVPKVISTA